MAAVSWERRHVNGWTSNVTAIAPDWFRATVTDERGDIVELCEGTQVDMLKHAADVALAARGPHACECEAWRRR